MKSSFLVGLIFSGLASKVLMLPLAQPVPVHPLFMVGLSGIVASALNLLPIFRLDGGRACYAVMGSRQGAIISVYTILSLISLNMTCGSGVMGILWVLFVANFQRRQEIPARDEVTEVDHVRVSAWLLSLILSITVLAPFPGGMSMV